MILRLSRLVIILILPTLLLLIPFVFKDYIKLSVKTLRILIVFEVVYVICVIMMVYGLTLLPI